MLRSIIYIWLFVFCGLLLSDDCTANVQPPPVLPPAAIPETPGDRVARQLDNLEEWIPATLSRENYRIGPGDTLNINILGRASLNYSPRPDATGGVDPNEVTVTPSGDIHLSLLGRVSTTGKTVAELETDIREGLAHYIRDFDVVVAVSKVRTVNVWISGEVQNSGPRILPAVSTVSLAVLQAGIKPTGSTRNITLVRGNARKTVDLYRMTITGELEGDLPLEPGDSIHVPPVTDYVEVKGEVTRPGRYEMVGISLDGDRFTVRDLVRLALETTPAAALDKAFIERIGDDGKQIALNLNLRGGTDSSNADIALQRGDTIVIPSIEAFQPIIRLIGEFKGDGVYQRVPGSTSTDIENKSGIYLLRQGQTVGHVITATGGVTPQADLKRARIERSENGITVRIPVDLEQLLVHGDESADVALASGDHLVLPALADRIHVFGEVKSPGSYIYSPNRRLIDYLGDAGGQTQRARLSSVAVVRGTSDSPVVTKLNTRNTLSKGDMSGNPVLEPGDIVVVPSQFISDWRDAVQLVITSLSLVNLLNRF